MSNTGKFTDYVRPIIALMIMGSLTWGFFVDKVGVEYMMGLATGVLSYYLDNSK